MQDKDTPLLLLACMTLCELLNLYGIRESTIFPLVSYLARLGQSWSIVHMDLLVYRIADMATNSVTIFNSVDKIPFHHFDRCPLIHSIHATSLGQIWSMLMWTIRLLRSIELHTEANLCFISLTCMFYSWDKLMSLSITLPLSFLSHTTLA